MDSTTYEFQKELVLKMLKEFQKRRIDIADNTVNQNKCNNWVVTRKKMVTSSMYGVICRMKDKTKRSRVISDILYKSSNKLNADMAYGLQHEEDASVTSQ